MATPETGGEQAPAEVVITGGAGQIGYQLAPLIASGQTFGNRTVNLRLLELPQAQQAAEGVAAELQDSAFPTLAGVDIHDDPRQAFDGATHVFMVGAMPRSKGMDRADLLEANAGIFKEQGAALEAADDDVRVLVVGNPANSNALVVAAQVPEIAENGHITAMSRLDHNRAVGMVATGLNVSAAAIDGITIWGNHSNSMVVDLKHAQVSGEAHVGREPLEGKLINVGVDLEALFEKIATRGGEIIALRGASSALSAARAASDHMGDWVQGVQRWQWETGMEDGPSWTSAAVLSRGEYGMPEGVYSSMPVNSVGGEFVIVDGLYSPDVHKDIKPGIKATGDELLAERASLEAAGFLPK